MFENFRRFFSKTSLPEASWLVVGLGNPGTEYEQTRHNVGFLTLDTMASKFESTPGAEAVHAIDGEMLLLKPLTYMNLSGEAVAPVVEELSIEPDKIIVIHDELDLPPGTVRVKKGGNENGHNGLKSISQTLETRDYLRVRIGIGRPDNEQTISDWVLSLADHTEAIDRAAEAVRLIVDEGLSKAQNVIHAR